MSYDDGFVVRLRGLPWSVGKEEVASFLAGCNIVDVHFTSTRDGRPSGEAYVEMSCEQDIETALEKNQQHMGKRYIEVFRAKHSEMEWVLQKEGQQNTANSDNVVRLRGLPFACTHDDIMTFFKGLLIVPNGIALLADDMGRASGEAYVQFASQMMADQALSKHKERMGTRYVEIFKSSMMEAETAIANQGRFNPGAGGGRGGMGGRPSPYDRTRGGARGAARGAGMRGRGAGNIKGLMSGYGAMSGSAAGGYGGYGNNSYSGGDNMGLGYNSYGGGSRGGASRGGGMRGGRGGGFGGSKMMTVSSYESSTGHSVHMRGLPFSASETDIAQFFSPLNPIMIVVGYNNDGRPSGEADVDFATHLDAQQAMKKDKALMERRYIELFLNSVPDDVGFNSFEDGDYGAGIAGFAGY